MISPSGRIAPKPVVKPTIKWTPGDPVIEGEGECNLGGLIGCLRAEPFNRVIDYKKAVKDIFDPVKTPHGSQLPDILKQAVKKGYIKSFVYYDPDEATVPRLKQLLHMGPVIVGTAFWSSFYAYQQGRIGIGGDKFEQGHTWFANTLNFKQRFIGLRSGWANTGLYMFPMEVLAYALEEEGELAQPIL